MLASRMVYVTYLYILAKLGGTRNAGKELLCLYSRTVAPTTHTLIVVKVAVAGEVLRRCCNGTTFGCNY